MTTAGHKQLVLSVVVAILLANLCCIDQDPAICRFFTAVTLAAENQVVENSPFELLPGVVVDPAAERLYLMNPQGGIDALELATGKLLWTSRAAGKPLAAFDDRLAAQAEPTVGSRSLPIVLLSTKDGGRVVSTIAVPLSSGAMLPFINNGMGAASSVQARVEPDGLLVSWTVTSRGISPIPRPPSVRSDSGAALIKLHA